MKFKTPSDIPDIEFGRVELKGDSVQVDYIGFLAPGDFFFKFLASL